MPYFANLLGIVFLVKSTAGLLVAAIYGLFLQFLNKLQEAGFLILSKDQLIASDKEV